MIDFFERLGGTSGTPKHDASISEESPQNCLIRAHAFDLGQEHLRRSAVDHSCFENHPLVRHRKLRRTAFNERLYKGHRPNYNQAEADSHKDVPIVRIIPIPYGHETKDQEGHGQCDRAQ